MRWIVVFGALACAPVASAPVPDDAVETVATGGAAPRAQDKRVPVSPLRICQAVARASAGDGDLPRPRRSLLPEPSSITPRPGASDPAVELRRVMSSLATPDGVLRLAQLLEQGLDPDRMVDGRPLLQAAIHSCRSGPSDVRRRRLDGVLLLLEAGADPDAASPRGTALHVAIEEGDIDAVDALLLAGADLEAKADGGDSPLMRAVVRNDAVMLNHLLHRGASWTAGALDRALARRRRAALEIAICHGADPKALRSRVRYGDEPNAAEERILALLDAAAIAGPVAAPAPMGPGRDPPWTDPPIALAARRGDAAEVARLIAGGASPDAVDVDGIPILHLALDANAPDVATLLLARGADPNLRPAIDDGRDAMPPLGIAARGDAALVRMLLKAGGEPNRVDARFMGAPLGEAATAEIVDLLVEHGADVEHRDALGWSVLQRAAMDGRTPAVAALLRHGADPNLSDFNGETALHQAAHHGHTTTVEALLANGADIEARTPSGQTALEVAVDRRQGETVAALARGGSPPASFALLESVLLRGDVELANQLLDQGVRPEKGRDVSLTPIVGRISPDLATAFDAGPVPAKRRRTLDAPALALVRRLIEIGWEVEPDILLSVHVPDPALVQLLLDHGADPNATTRDRTVLHGFATAGADAAIAVLLAAGADATATTPDGETPLHHAARGPIDGRPSDGPPPDWEGDTPHYVKAIKLLRAAGVDPAARTKFGRTALDVADLRPAAEMEPIRAALR